MPRLPPFPRRKPLFNKFLRKVSGEFCDLPRKTVHVVGMPLAGRKKGGVNYERFHNDILHRRQHYVYGADGG
jgi:hypothetical protein